MHPATLVKSSEVYFFGVGPPDRLPLPIALAFIAPSLVVSSAFATSTTSDDGMGASAVAPFAADECMVGGEAFTIRSTGLYGSLAEGKPSSFSTSRTVRQRSRPSFWRLSAVALRYMAKSTKKPI
jgi:hypothetical protein